MALTFDLSNDIGKVRELLGDTNITSAETAMFTDEEVQFYLDRWSHVAETHRPDWHLRIWESICWSTMLDWSASRKFSASTSTARSGGLPCVMLSARPGNGIS